MIKTGHKNRNDSKQNYYNSYFVKLYVALFYGLQIVN